MAGLLGDSFDDPQTLATMQLAAGLLGPGSFGTALGRGLLGYQGSQASTQDLAIKKQALDMQKLQFAAALRNQNLINEALDQRLHPQGAPQVQGAAPAGAPMTGGTAGAGTPFGGDLFGVPGDAGLNDLMFNGGKGLGDLALKAMTPTRLPAGGYAAYPGQKPFQLPIAAPGAANVPDSGPTGYRTVQVPGGQEAIAAAEDTKAKIAAGYKQIKFLGPDNQEYTGWAKDVMPSTPPAVPPAQSANPAPAANPAPPPMVSSDFPRIQGAGALDAAAQLEAFAGKPTTDAYSKRVALQQAQQLRAGSGDPTPSGAPTVSVRTGLAPGVATGANNAQDTMNRSYQTVMASAAPAQTVQARLDQIAQFSKGAILGGDTQWRDQANNLLSIAGISDRATDRKTAGDLLDKNASQIALAIGSGTQGTDALRSLAAAANPSRKMTQPAIDEAVAQLQGSAKVQQAKAQLLTPLYNAGNPNAYNAAEQAFDKSADYRLWQLRSATQGMTGQQVAAYLKAKGYTPQQVQQLSAQRKTLQQLGVDI